MPKKYLKALTTLNIRPWRINIKIYVYIYCSLFSRLFCAEESTSAQNEETTAIGTGKKPNIMQY